MDGAEFLSRVREVSPDTVRILLTGYADLRSAMNAINKAGVYRFLTKPWDEENLKHTIQEGLDHFVLLQENQHLLKLAREQNVKLVDLNTNLEHKVTTRTEELRQVFAQLELNYSRLDKTFIDSIMLFASLLELRYTFAGSHSTRVARLSMGVGKKLGLPEGEMKTLQVAALLHDIGKIGISEKLLKRPFAMLSKMEREILMQHLETGYQHLQLVDGLKEASRLIKSHHERIDGSGYPDGLVGDEIELGTMILAVANDYDTLIHGMLLDGEWTEQKAQQFLLDAKGKWYGSEVVDAFLASLKEI